MQAVDPNTPTYQDASRSDMEWWLLFCAAVANAKSDHTTKALGKFKFYMDSPEFPLMRIHDAAEDEPEVFEWAFQHAGFRFQRTKRTFIELANAFWCRDLREVSIEELESIHGIGPKTSRFFKITTVRGARHAALDVHILRWLKHLGYDNIPKSTPTGSSYARIEQYFIQEADKRGKDINDLDLEVWTAGKDGGIYDG